MLDLNDPIDPQKVDEAFMKMALAQAQTAFENDEVPVGAVVVCKGKVIAKGHNQSEQLKDATAHAEMLAITSAANYLGSKYLEACTLYVTLEPCAMCACASNWSHVPRIVFGAYDAKKGFLSNNWRVQHPRAEVVGGILEAESSELLKRFFKNLRS
jgi:tRNA(adenine34) deaminase